jgi:DNA-binding MarR family transcriptional regulator
MLASTTLAESRAVRTGRDVHINVLLLAQHCRTEMEAICQQVGLSEPQYAALWTLCLADEAGEGLPIRAIADGLINRAADTTRLVDRMERDGFVERLPNPADRRSVLVRATHKGAEAFATVTPQLQEWHARQWSHLTKAELDTLRTLVAKALWGAQP